MNHLIKIATLTTLTLICSCAKDNQIVNNRPVNLLEDDTFETYFVKSSELLKKLDSEGFAKVQFQFFGSTPTNSDHNVKQAKAIAWAISQPQTKNKLFIVSLSGAATNPSMREPFMAHLGTCGVKLQQIQISKVPKNSETPLVENLLQNYSRSADLITVTIQNF